MGMKEGAGFGLAYKVFGVGIQPVSAAQARTALVGAVLPGKGLVEDKAAASIIRLLDDDEKDAVKGAVIEVKLFVDLFCQIKGIFQEPGLCLNIQINIKAWRIALLDPH